ncbi:MAG: hypothetical protein ISQ09_07045 [Rubripirellula sp.]|nr:hypothetical protein [Rubripirellula sp.]
MQPYKATVRLRDGCVTLPTTPTPMNERLLMTGDPEGNHLSSEQKKTPCDCMAFSVFYW